MQKTKQRMLVLGGGIAGLSTAYCALQRGWQVTLCDRSTLSPPREQSSTSAYGGLLFGGRSQPIAQPGASWDLIRRQSTLRLTSVASPSVLRWLFKLYLASTPQQASVAASAIHELHSRSREMLFQWESDGVAFGLVKKGLLELCSTHDGLASAEADAAKARNFGLPAQLLTHAEAESLDPNLTHQCVGAIYYPRDGFLDPVALVDQMRSKLVSLGATLEFDRHVIGWRTKENSIRALQTNRGDLDADEYVVCGGAWTQDLVRSLHVSLPMLAGHGYSILLPDAIEVPSLGVSLREHHLEMIPQGTNVRFSSTPTLGPLNVAPAPEGREGLINAICQVLPRYKMGHFDGIPASRSVSAVSPDGMPYVGRVSAWKNLSVVSGHGPSGGISAPATGALMVDLLSGSYDSNWKQSECRERFSPDRYS
jgi:D-amino-acid dehydrogenase